MLEKHHYFVPVVSILDGNSYHENIAYVAEYNPKIIGIMFGSIHSLYEYFNSDYADLIALYIDSVFKVVELAVHLNNGLGKIGASKYVIGVLKDNVKARKVYELWENYQDMKLALLNLM